VRHLKDLGMTYAQQHHGTLLSLTNNGLKEYNTSSLLTAIMSANQGQPKQPRTNSANASNKRMANNAPPAQQGIPEHEIKQNSGVSATMALQAMQKAWDLRQAANAAGDPNAREEILAKAINKEIEAESFGKAAKYTQVSTHFHS
jgi:hypothetical protein